MIIKDYSYKLDNSDIRNITYLINEKGNIDNVINYYIKDLDCTRVYSDGGRPMQTINFRYKLCLAAIEYLLDMLYNTLVEHPEKAQSYIDYRKSIINNVKLIHEKNINYEKEHPVLNYTKKSKTSVRRNKQYNKTKDVFTGEPIDVGTGVAKAIKPRKETIADRKTKLLNERAIKFASNKSFKISE